jgi:hypothetical protein
MTAALTPALALDYLRELSADLQAAVLLAADGGRLAGPDHLAGPARALLDAVPDAPELHGVARGHHVFAARDERHALVVVTGAQVLNGLLRHDLWTVLAALGGGIHAGAPKTPPDGVVVAVLEAAHRPAQDVFGVTASIDTPNS